MTGKLIKYDFKSMIRRFGPLWVAFIGVSIINRFTLRLPEITNSAFSSITSVISMLLYVVLMVAINIIGLVLIIQRFYAGLLKDEGYLMFTLPVKPWQHIFSKGLTATVLISANALISILSVFILAINADFLEGYRQLLQELAKLNLNFGLLLSLSLILLLVTTLKSIYQIYASAAIGHLANRHRVGYSVGAYIAISMILSIIGSIGVTVVSLIDNGNWIMRVLGNFMEYITVNGAVWGVFFFLFVLTMVQVVVFHVITERILAKRLNLE